jgi:hypothetical protein
LLEHNSAKLIGDSIGSQPGIPGGSTLIFDIELLAIN